MSFYKVRNPRNGEIDYQFELLSEHTIKEKCTALRTAQTRWWAKGIDYRILVLQDWKKSVLRHKEAIIQALTLDTGRYRESVLEADLIEKSIDKWCGIAKNYFDNQVTKTSSIPFIEVQQSVMPYPLVGVISPWNFPLLLSLIDSIPALLAGCAVIVKPSEVTPRFVEPMMAAIAEVPALASILQYIPGNGQVGAALISAIDLVCFTGSVATGKKVYQAAAEFFIPAYLELGGKDPALVFEGADLDLASSALLWASTSNCGHSCLSIERIYVQAQIFDEFVEKIVAKAKQIKLAHPSVNDGQIGPIIAERQVEIINDHLKDAIEKGAILHTGHAQCEWKDGAYWCLPTVLTNMHHEMKIMSEETFGPILPIMSFKDKAEAIHLANDTQFGLSAAVFAASWEEARQVGNSLKAGAISINDAGLTAIVHDGEKNAFKYSGMGATRMGPAAIQRFMRQQAFLVKKAPIASPWWY